MITDKRYQVFVSSTFIDLQDERQAVLKAILELDHMPAGMELFPAGDDEAWQLICDVIDRTDYYVVIVGGRYGSTDPEGASFTEREHDYAVQQKIPVIALLHHDPESLPRDHTEVDKAAWDRLLAFRTKLEKQHTCVYWRTAEELKAKVIVGLTAEMKRRPAVGWVRADQIPSGTTVVEVLGLRNRIAELERDAAAARVSAPTGAEDLEQGDDEITIHITFKARSRTSYTDVTGFKGGISLTWDEIYAAIAPTLINEASDTELRGALRRTFTSKARGEWSDQDKLKGKILEDFEFQYEELDTCIVQFRALGLIRESVRPRSVKNTETYWTLTPYGDYQMTQLRAIRRVPISAATTIEPAREEGRPKVAVRRRGRTKT